MTLSDYLPVLLTLIAASLVGIGGVAVSWLLGPRKPSATKSETYESGMQPIGTARIRFPVKFYLVAMLFIIFDVEVVFFYPLAVVYKLAAPYFFVEMLVFIAILLVGYIYIWKQRVLDWN